MNELMDKSKKRDRLELGHTLALGVFALAAFLLGIRCGAKAGAIKCQWLGSIVDYASGDGSAAALIVGLGVLSCLVSVWFLTKINKECK